jgi:hypothetical protein
MLVKLGNHLGGAMVDNGLASMIKKDRELF